MDYELNEDQRAIVDSVDALLRKHAGPKRAIALDREGAYDHELHRALEDAGFFGVARDVGLLEATLITERIAKHAGTVSFGATAIVAQLVSEKGLSAPVALANDGNAPMRYATAATCVLVTTEDPARLIPLDPKDVRVIPSSFGFPLGRIDLTALRGVSLGQGSGARARDLTRLALAAECVGTMEGALDLTVRYVSQRFQFGRAIGSFQAVQHRLALLKVMVEGARLLTYEAAYANACPERAAQAAAYATAAAQKVHSETHQLTGALGFTREHDLFIWSMRLEALRLELGGTSAHRRALAQARWGLSA